MEDRNQTISVVLQYSHWRVREKTLKMTLGEYYRRIVEPHRYETRWWLEPCGSLAERKKGFRVKEVIRKAKKSKRKSKISGVIYLKEDVDN